MMTTKEKIEDMLRKGEPIGCPCCLERLDDGKHEYDAAVDLFYCPAMDDNE